MLHQLLHQLVVFWFNLVSEWGYLGVVLLMAMESSIFPVPSEVVVPPAAYWAAQPGAKMSFWGVIIAGTIGSYLGSAVTYGVSKWVGRIVIVRWGKYFFISEDKLERAERFMHRYEAGGVFFARLLPVLRHLISIPAGIIRMNFLTFSVVTTIGAFIWCSVLAWLGREAAVKHPGLINDPEQMVHAMKAEAMPIVLGVLGLAALYFIVLKLTADRGPSTPAGGTGSAS
jgi:membrane protein DedA with SNARE-associated domain